MIRRPYSERLRDPRWQRRRLEVMARAKFRCESCGCARSFLHVHHKEYRRGRAPWDYPDDLLACLCESCHETAHGRGQKPDAAPAVARGNLVRQAIGLLVHFPAAGALVVAPEAVGDLDRPGVPLLLELLAQLREDPVSSTGALLERWRGRPEHAPLSRLASGERLALDTESAARDIRWSLERIAADHALDRMLRLAEKARTKPLSDEEKERLANLLRASRGLPPRAAQCS